MKTPVIHLWPDEAKLAWEVYKAKVRKDMTPRGPSELETLLGIITPPELMPSEWPSELQEKLTKEEQEAIYQRIKDKNNALEDIVIFLKPE